VPFRQIQTTVEIIQHLQKANKKTNAILLVIQSALMFACPLFRKFCKLNKTAKLKGGNIDDVTTLIGIVCCVV